MYIKTIILGNIGATENWSTSFTWQNFGTGQGGMSQSMIESLATRLVTNVTATSGFTALRPLWSSSVNVSGWRVEQRDENEQLVNVGQASYSSVVAGTGSATKTPQDALVASLRTGTPGARGRGRLYWPALAASLSAEFALASPTSQSIATGTAVLADLVGDQLNAEYAANSMLFTVELAVRSVTDHQCRKVERIQVGSALDTQRRRRDKLVETYAVQTYPLP